MRRHNFHPNAKTQQHDQTMNHHHYYHQNRWRCWVFVGVIIVPLIFLFVSLNNHNDWTRPTGESMESVFREMTRHEVRLLLLLLSIAHCAEQAER